MPCEPPSLLSSAQEGPDGPSGLGAAFWKCGHQWGSHQVTAATTASETSVTAAPGYCRGHLATISLRSTSFPHPPCLVTSPLAQHPSVAPKHPQCKCSKWAPRALANLCGIPALGAPCSPRFL